MLTPRRPRTGFSLIEMLVVISMIGILLALALPAFGRLAADWHVRATAESLASALRLTKANAVARSHNSVFALTSATPRFDSAAVTNGSNWFFRLIPSAGSDETAASLGLIQSATLATQYGVSIGSAAAPAPAALCFNALGQQASLSSDRTGLSAACVAPNDDVRKPTQYLVSAAGATRQFKVLVYLGGEVRMCDAAKTLSNDNPDGCP